MFKMNLLLFMLLVIPIVVSTNDSCLKVYKQKLCFKVSIEKYNSCLFTQFVVFEQNNKFCASNTKCVSKISTCLGITFKIKLQKISIFYFFSLN